MADVLFISYSRVDRPWMQTIRTHLEGGLRGSGFRVWADRDIQLGLGWEESLRTALRGSGSALVLASPEYLVSEWCRRELAMLHEMHRKEQISAIYWVLLRPCAWEWTTLRDLQAVQSPVTAAVESTPKGPERDQLVLDLCTRITADLLRAGPRENARVAFVRDLLQRCDKMYRPTRELGRGRFAIACQGLDADDKDIVIKVLIATPLHSLRTLFEQVCEKRRALVDPSIVRVREIFSDGVEPGERLVVVTDLAPDKTLAQRLDEPGELNVRLALRRIASVLAKLHELSAVTMETDGVSHRPVMGPLFPEQIFWDDRSRRPVLSLVSVTNFLWQFFDPSTFNRLLQLRGNAYDLPELLEPCDPRLGGVAARPDERADQYFLGMLALEMLERRRLFDAEGAPRPAAMLEQCRHASTWARDEQLVRLIGRLIEPVPLQRFPSMAEVVDELLSLEEPERVLAKYAYRRWVEPAGRTFSAAFYRRLFAEDHATRDIFARRFPSGGGETTLPDEHHDKLIRSLTAVLNYRRGNSPSSILPLLPMHRHLGLGEPQLASFCNNFVRTLEQTIGGDVPAQDCAEICAAWSQLFVSVFDEMRRDARIIHAGR